MLCHPKGQRPHKVLSIPAWEEGGLTSIYIPELLTVGHEEQMDALDYTGAHREVR